MDMMATQDNVVDKIESLRLRMDEILNKPDVATKGYEQCVELLYEFSKLPITKQILASTKIGVYVAKLRKHDSHQIKKFASTLVNQWKRSIEAHSSSEQNNGKPSDTDGQKGVTDRPTKTVDINEGNKVTPITTQSNTETKRQPTSVYNNDESGIDSYGSKRIKVSSESNDTKFEPKTPFNSSSISKEHKFTESYTINSQSTPIPNLKSENNPDKQKSADTDNQQKESSTFSPNYRGVLTQVQIRDKARQFLYTGFINGLPRETLVELDVNSINNLISQIEDETWKSAQSTLNTSSKAYNMQIKSIKWNLADKENPQFNLRIYSGEITPSEVAKMESKEMASNDKKLERKKELQRSLEACQSDWDKRNLEIRDGQFTCFRCKGKKTTYQQIQIRSADEPMTTFVTCITCNNRWKF